MADERSLAINLSPDTLADFLVRPVLRNVPRLLTQVDRNLHSPTFGCCCRAHWHDHAVAIPQARMQEMVLTVALLWKMNRHDNPYVESPLILDWIEAMLHYTVRIQRRNGSFDESYRGESSFEATAALSFCISETVLQLGRTLTASLRGEVEGMLYRAATWLGRHANGRPGTQLSCAALAFTNLNELDPERGYEDGLDALLELLETAQMPEGWFPENGGADIGRSSMAHGCLALIARRTGERRAMAMAQRSADFLQHFLHRDGTAGGVYGSCNTAYFLPLAAVLGAGKHEATTRIYHALFHPRCVEAHAPLLDRVDERSLASLSPYYLLAAQAVPKIPPEAHVRPTPWCGSHFDDASGLWVVENDHGKLIINVRKGGVFHLDMGDRTFVDNGYFGDIPDGQVVTTQLWDPATEVSVVENRARLSALLLVNKPRSMSPWRFMGHRFLHLVLPELIRKHLFRSLRKRNFPIDTCVGRVHREVVVTPSAVEVTDHIQVFEPVLNLVLQRETAQARSNEGTEFYHPQELSLDEGPLPIDLATGHVTLRRRYTAEGLVILE